MEDRLQVGPVLGRDLEAVELVDDRSQDRSEQEPVVPRVALRLRAVPGVLRSPSARSARSSAGCRGGRPAPSRRRLAGHHGPGPVRSGPDADDVALTLDGVDRHLDRRRVDVEAGERVLAAAALSEVGATDGDQVERGADVTEERIVGVTREDLRAAAEDSGSWSEDPGCSSRPGTRLTVAGRCCSAPPADCGRARSSCRP